MKSCGVGGWHRAIVRPVELGCAVMNDNILSESFFIWDKPHIPLLVRNSTGCTDIAGPPARNSADRGVWWWWGAGGAGLASTARHDPTKNRDHVLLHAEGNYISNQIVFTTIPCEYVVWQGMGRVEIPLLLVTVECGCTV